MSPLCLHISTLGGPACHLHVEASATVRSAKQQIETQLHIPWQEQRLLLGSLELADDDCPIGMSVSNHAAQDNVTQNLQLQMLRVPLRTLVWKSGFKPTECEFSIASYSVSSDLSNMECPKSTLLMPAMQNGLADPSSLAWTLRQKRIIEELLHYRPNIICVQGLQAKVSYCCLHPNELPEWNHADDHAMHLFRELSKHDYSMLFRRALTVPGQQGKCFGSAVFWKTSLFQLKNIKMHHGFCIAVLWSQQNQVALAVCSSKTIASYARDWGEVDVGFQGEETAQMALIEAIHAGALPVWCGDFGCHLPEFLTSTQALVPGGLWKSAASEIFGDDSWTALSPHDGSQRCSDWMLFDSRLEVCAALSGLRNSVNLVEHLGAGNPSEHVMQLSIFRPAS